MIILRSVIKVCKLGHLKNARFRRLHATLKISWQAPGGIIAPGLSQNIII